MERVRLDSAPPCLFHESNVGRISRTFARQVGPRYQLSFDSVPRASWPASNRDRC